MSLVPLKPYRPPSDDVIIDSLPIHGHLGMTEESMKEMCLGLWDCDVPIQKHRDRQQEFDEKKSKYAGQVEEHMVSIRAIEAKEDVLNTELRFLDTQKREIRGKVSSIKFHSKLADDRIRAAEVAITARKKQLFFNEAKRRLTALGKELKQTRGRRAGSATVQDLVETP